MGFTVFLEPSGELQDAILGWKKKVDRHLPNQVYWSHPPHCTMIHSEVQSEEKAVSQIRNILPRALPFKVQVERVGIFWDDEATGGHTLYLCITPNPKLNELQRLVAESIRPIIRLTCGPIFVDANPAMKKSYKKYGFPFVGSHWIPHLSIASLRTERSHPIIADFESWQPRFEFNVNELSCWHVAGDDHIPIERFSIL